MGQIENNTVSYILKVTREFAFVPLDLGVENAVHRKISESRRVSEPNKNKALEGALLDAKKAGQAVGGRPAKSREE